MKLFKYDFYEKGNDAKILVLSDLHYYRTKENKRLEKIINHIENNSYTAIFLVGDIIDNVQVLDDKKAYATLLDFLTRLSKHAQVYISFGSHDMATHLGKRLKYDLKKWNNLLTDIKKIPNLFSEANITYKIDANKTVTIINPHIFLKSEEELSNEYAFLKNLNPHQYNILLCHYPNFVMNLAQKGYLQNVNLALSGHNHNGMTQLKIFPLEWLLNHLHEENRGIITPDKSFNFKKTKYLRGVITLKKTKLIINPAYTSLPYNTKCLRYFNFLFYKGGSILNFKK